MIAEELNQIKPNHIKTELNLDKLDGSLKDHADHVYLSAVTVSHMTQKSNIS